ncbi:M23 family metallopeptidase [Microbacterium sp. 10M-3C3]|uniref:M23 family metallopeptidase n=1 Tax=Microbacterium sp. 10M-3C3 TaxID=2483401 RepID=UPI000F63C788|nr:M23 family metallopeptidase [Microbacterium sp. 10M-3C3]
MNTPRVRPAGGRLAGSLRTLATGSVLTLPGALTAEECGCAPTPAESRAFRAGVSRRTLLTAGTASVVAVLVAGPLLPAAFAATYPSWEEVQAAKTNEATKAAEVQRIQGLIQSLTGDVARTRTAAEQAAGAFYTAQQEYFDASIRADTLQSQADVEAQNAPDAANKAGRIAAQLCRDGGDTTSLELFFSGSAATADDLLSRLGVMDKLLERNQAVYAAALTARDAAQSLTDQAVVARDERDRLQQVAEQKMLESQQAADAAQAALDAQTLYLGELQAQLAALEDTTAKTIADYQAGVEAARLAEEQRRAAERAEAERLAASGGGGGVVSSGWARPTSGHRTSGFGPRSSQCGNGYCSTSYHYGVDLSGGCGAGIYAAAAGTVVYAGYGNYIKIDHGGGIGTGYAHIRPGGFYVGYGQRVNAGDLIGSEGNTGNAFGCNLHFEAYVNGSPVNPITFLADCGVSI